MENLLAHFYRYAESYTVALAWAAVPLGFFALYLRVTKRAEVPVAARGKRKKR